MIMIAIGRGARPSTVRILHAEPNETHRGPLDDQESEDNLAKRNQVTRRWRNHNSNNNNHYHYYHYYYHYYYEAEETGQSSQQITLDDEKTTESSLSRPMPSRRTERTMTTLSQRRPRNGHWPTTEQNSITQTCTSKSTTKSPPKLFPIMSALVYQIIIISLILHKIPPTFASSQLQLDPHNDQRQLVALEPLPTSQKSNEIYISNNHHQHEHQDHKTKTTMGMKARQQISELHQHQQHKEHRDNRQDADDNQRPYRQRGSSFMKSEPLVARAGQQQSLGSVSSSSNRLKRHLGELDAPKDGADCRRLAALWLFLQSSYPSLSSHLIEWAGQASEGASDEQHLLASSSQAARTIGHLLADAERLMAAVQGDRPAATSKPWLHQIRQNSQPQPAWLARVSSNPTYARLVQHLRTRQRANHNSQHDAHQQRPSAASLGAGLEGVEDSDATLAGSRAAVPDEEDEEAAAGASQPHQANHEQEYEQRDHSAAAAAAYGRVFHYPHELANGAENSHGMARTLDKLRLLKQQQQQQQQQQQLAAIGGGSDTSENSRIPLAATPSADVDQVTEGDWRRLGNLATDAARNNFVYGTVLLRPPSHHPEHEQQPHRSMSTLREMTHEQERQRLLPLSSERRPAQPSDSFGRVVSGHAMHGQESNNDDKSAHHNQHRERQQETEAEPSEIAEPQASQQQQQQQYNDVLVAYDGSQASNELASQQRFQQMAAMDGGEVAAPSNDGDEFEGEFHAGPLKQPEVRLLRSLNQPQQQTGEAAATKGAQGHEFALD